MRKLLEPPFDAALVSEALWFSSLSPLLGKHLVFISCVKSKAFTTTADWCIHTT